MSHSDVNNNLLFENEQKSSCVNDFSTQMTQLTHARNFFLPSSNALIPISKRSHMTVSSVRNNKSNKKD